MEAPILFESLLAAPVGTVVVTSVATTILLLTSGIPVNVVLTLADIDPPGDDTVDTGTVIGKLENLLVMLLVLVNAYTALSVVSPESPSSDRRIWTRVTVRTTSWGR